MALANRSLFQSFLLHEGLERVAENWRWCCGGEGADWRFLEGFWGFKVIKIRSGRSEITKIFSSVERGK
jgi:hypothetical protein